MDDLVPTVKTQQRLELAGVAAAQPFRVELE